MYQTFDTWFQFHESTVRHQIDHAAFDFRADRVLGFDIVPRIGQFLLQTEADAFFFVIDVQYDNVDFLSDGQELGWVVDAAPAHVGDVEQAVQTVEIDKGTEIGDVLDRALADIAGGHVGEQFGAAFGAFLFDQFTA